MKPPWEWSEDDIQALIDNGVKESIDLDYKRCDALLPNAKKDLRVEVSKDVSAFANSAGGTIVYGVVEKDNLPVQIDAGFDPKQISREWLEQIIDSNIRRRIDGLRINQVDLRKSQPGRVLYVVHAPQSTRAPHMAADNRFYKRYEFRSVPMEEYEVRDVARRDQVPDLRCKLMFRDTPDGEVLSAPLELTSDRSALEPTALTASISNRAAAVAEYCHIIRYFDSRLDVVSASDLRQGWDASVSVGGIARPLKSYFLNWSVPEHMPIWEGRPFGVVPGRNEWS